jgi:eukaryotic-like serine/threonine-protein kinase
VALGSGTRLGTYVVTSLVGAGGMGEVYQAHDTKLDRDVAIKVLPEKFSRDSERLARFHREARMLAALNHPNIAAIYGFEQADSTHYLVMELVPGQTLRARVTGQKPVPVNEALLIARQIAEALEAAHGSERGIIHRDLKPANVKVTPEGKVKVLDFGLAKAFVNDTASQDFANAPTLSANPTMQGAIMGTAAYMSPEQARGEQVTKASDIWAFGCVLYELLTGQAAFGGEHATEILAAVVKVEPDWTHLPEATPPGIRTLLRRCLHKDRRQRLQDATDARLEIEDALAWVAAGGAQAEAASAVKPRWTREGLAWLAAAVLLISTAALWAWLAVLRSPPDQPQSIRFSVGPPGNGTFYAGPNVVAVSPDGKKLALVASNAPTKPLQLWIRSLDAEAARPLAGTENPIQAFWSPDSRFLAFYADGKLKKIAIAGGPAETLADAPAGGDQGSWSREGVILFAPRGMSTTAIYRVSSTGGEATPVTTLDASRQEVGHSWPYFLPDGKHFLYLARCANRENDAVYVGSLDSPEKKRILNALSNVVYVAPGYLLFSRQGTLMAQAFDAGRIELTGDEVPIAEHVSFNGVNGRADVSASDTGVLSYRTWTAGGLTQLVWFDRSGTQLGVLGDPGVYFNLALSPDGTRVAVAGNDDIWIYDVASGRRTRFTFDPAAERDMLWSPDGRRIIFSSDRKGLFDLYQKASDGSGTEELLYADAAGNKSPESWSVDGRVILYDTGTDSPRTGADLFVLPLSGAPSTGPLRGSGQAGEGRRAVPFIQTQFNELEGRLSPDGRWVAYSSNESGAYEVYVAPYPGPGGTRQISTAGGGHPRWRGDGAEIFYLAPDNRLMAATVNGKRSSFEVGEVKPLFETHTISGLGNSRYDVTADGQRFLVNTATEARAAEPITVVVNWTAGLKK